MSTPTSAMRWLPYLAALLFGLALAYLNLHTDETPFVAIPLFACTAMLGFIAPRAAWRWALLVGLWLPASQLLALAVGMRLPYPNDLGGALAVALPGLGIGLAGAYAGVLGRWLVGLGEAPGAKGRSL